MRNLSVIQLILMSMILVSLTSCQEEEFYEKEYIESFKEKYDQEQEAIVEVLDEQNPNDDDDSNNDDDDDSNNDDDDDSNNDDDDDSNNDDDDDSNNDDDDDSNNDDDDDSNNDDDDDSNNDDDDDSNNDDDDAVQTTSVEDSFTQSATAQQKLDILWVVDNSGSMKDEQENLGKNFKAFIDKFSTLGIDFKMSITTTDTRGNNAGMPVKDSIEKLTSEELSKDRQAFLNNFNKMVQVGIRGWGYEKGLKASESFSNRFAKSHFRDDAYFVIIYVSDEEDQSEKTVANHLKQISKWKSNAGLVKAYSIVDTSNPVYNNSYLVSGFKRYKDMSDLTGGYIADINNDFYTTLLKMGNDIAQLTKSFPLSQVPYDISSIKVLVNGVEDTRWIFDPANRTIKFNEGQEPKANDTIVIKYEVES
jgi:hypothetical protein